MGGERKEINGRQYRKGVPRRNKHSRANPREEKGGYSKVSLRTRSFGQNFNSKGNKDQKKTKARLRRSKPELEEVRGENGQRNLGKQKVG